MNIKIINRNEIRLRRNTTDEYIRLTIAGHLAVFKSVSVCDLVRGRKKRNLVGNGVATVVINQGVIYFQESLCGVLVYA